MLIELLGRIIFAAMLRRFTVILLLAAFVAQTFTGSLIRLDYFFNTGAYAKNCINKARPKMHCNGNCQAMKKIREEEKKDQDNTDRKYDTKLPVLSSRSFFPSLTAGFSSLVVIDHYQQDDGQQIKMPRSYFHPPSA